MRNDGSNGFVWLFSCVSRAWRQLEACGCPPVKESACNKMRVVHAFQKQRHEFRRLSNPQDDCCVNCDCLANHMISQASFVLSVGSFQASLRACWSSSGVGVYRFGPELGAVFAYRCNQNIFFWAETGKARLRPTKKNVPTRGLQHGTCLPKTKV